jgi:hypothetical protein
MKKIALTSLLAVVAASAAHASINVIDGNPLYMPQKGHFYSETSLASNTQDVNVVMLGEKFGYGITDRLAISVSTSLGEANWFDGNMWDELGADVTWRVINDKAWKLDVMGGFEMDPVWGDHVPFMDKDTTMYKWTAGVRGGYVNNDWTLAAHVNFIYGNTEAFNWGDDDPFWANHKLNLGVAGHWTMSDTWSAVASADYYKVLDHYNDYMVELGDEEVSNKGYWDLTLGLNMNIDTTKYVGAYLTRTINRAPAGKLEGGDGYGFGLKFGIDF